MNAIEIKEQLKSAGASEDLLAKIGLFLLQSS